MFAHEQKEPSIVKEAGELLKKYKCPFQLHIMIKTRTSDFVEKIQLNDFLGMSYNTCHMPHATRHNPAQEHLERSHLKPAYQQHPPDHPLVARLRCMKGHPLIHLDHDHRCGHRGHITLILMIINLIRITTMILIIIMTLNLIRILTARKLAPRTLPPMVENPQTVLPPIQISSVNIVYQTISISI